MKHFFFKPFKKPKKCLLRIGSSETTREAPFLRSSKKHKIFSEFDFRAYATLAPLHVKNQINPDFLEWFMGFAEGDGTFYIRNSTGLKPRLFFEIGQKDPKVLYWIKKTLGFGTVRSWQRNGTQYWVYQINSKPNIQRLIHLFNGNLILTKRKIQFEKWLKAAKLANCLPPHFQKRNWSRFMKVSTKTAWLAGFIDAEGCFYANLSTPSSRSSVSRNLKQKFHLTQKNVYDEKKVLQEIAILFHSRAKVQQLSRKRNEVSRKTSNFRIEISSLTAHQRLVKYLTRFPLKTQKWIAFSRWARVLKAQEMQYHLCEENLPRLKRLCEAINQTRF